MNPEHTSQPSDLEERLRFETLIADLSSKFVNLPAGDVDREITDAQRRICELLHLDFATLWQGSNQVQGTFTLTHFYSALEGPRPPASMREDQYPWAREQLLTGRTIMISSPEELPMEAARDRETLTQFGIKSNLAIPLSVGGEPLVGILGLGTMRLERDWPEALVQGLRMAAQIFASALARKRADLALRESEERLSMAVDAAGLGIWGWDVPSGDVWGSPRWMDLFGFASTEQVTFEKTIQRISQDDRERVRADVRRSLEEGGRFAADFRVLQPNGTLRWINSRGKPCPGTDGEPLRMLGAAIDVTERKRAEEAFRATEARLAAGTELAGLGYYEADYAGRTCYLDERFREICGVPSDLLDGLEPVQFWMEHVHPDDCQLVQEERQKLHNGNVDRIALEYRYLHPALGRRWLHHSARVAERRAGGAGNRTFGVVRDITEHKQLAEEQAEDSRFGNLIADLSSKFVNLPAAEVDQAIEDAQRRVCEFLGLDLSALWQPVNETPDEYRLTHHYSSMGGPPITTMSAKDNFPWCQQQLLAGNVIAVPSVEELPPEAARDQEVWHHFGIKTSLTVPMSTGGASVIGFLSFSDTTRERAWPGKLVNRLQLVAEIFANALARKLADQQLRESEEVNRATFEQAAAGIAHVGTDGRWLRVNDKLCAILGYSREELLQMTFQDITHPNDPETDLNYVRQMLAGEIQTYSAENRYIRKDGSLVWINLTVSLVRTAAGEPKHFISVVEDITERKGAEEEMQRLRLQLWHADRVAQTGAITASLAHELNQPLTGILSTAQAGLRFLASGKTDPTLTHEILTNIVHDTKRAGAVINGLRAMLRRKETQREPLSLADTIREILHLLHSELVSRQVEYRLQVESDCQVLADKAQIQQVLLNLIMNALEAMQSQPLERRRLELTFGRTSAGEAQVAVRDSGPGIASDQQEKLFLAFWTTKPQGMGIGLSISYSIIESHGGRLWCANNPDGGATFHFTVPLATAGASSGPEAGPTTAQETP
jgi:PAS domain S-box-containing protein